MNWRDRAACRNAVITPGADPWFPNGDEELAAEALEYCEFCPVKRDCLNEFRTAPARVGVWGGRVYERVRINPAEQYSEATNARRLALYNQGLTDREMAAAEGIGTTTACKWRRSHELPVNTSGVRGVNNTKERRTELHSWGLTDQQMADREQTSSATIKRWRERWQLSANQARAG